MAVAQKTDGTGGVGAIPPTPAPVGKDTSRRITVIEPRRGAVGLDLADVWEYRDLLLTFAQRDVKLRYRQTALGVVWVAAQPLLYALIFNVVFGILAKMPSGGKPYFLFALTGFMGFSAFSNTLNKASASLVQNANLVSKIYFPRLVLPLSTVFSTMIDFGVTLVMTLILTLFFHIWPTFALLLLPVWMVLLLTMAIGAGLFTAALMVSYRDVQYVMPIFISLLTYATPVGYSVAGAPVSSLVKWFFQINPLTGLMEGVRWSLLGTDPPSFASIAYAAIVAVALLVGGLISFRRMERRFADVI